LKLYGYKKISRGFWIVGCWFSFLRVALFTLGEVQIESLNFSWYAAQEKAMTTPSRKGVKPLFCWGKQDRNPRALM
jgi:hypothetical protein